MMWILASLIYVIIWINFFVFFCNIFLNDPNTANSGKWIAITALLFGFFWPIAAVINTGVFVYGLIRGN